jgi:putative transposase
MPRAPRIQASDVLYHVGSRAVDKQPIFGVVPFDREYFLDLVAKVVRVYGVRVHAYCVMGNHFHLVLDTPLANLSEAMRDLKSGYAQWFNTYKPREGALFERRFWHRIPRHESYVYELARYVALNPVRAGVVRSPEEWPWSSYAATAGYERTPSFLYLEQVLACFGGDATARGRYVDFVNDGLRGALLSPEAEGA